MDAVHAAGGSSWTIKSLVADLPNGVVYLYYFYQFDQPVVLNVAEEIAHPRAHGALSKLFPQDVQQEAAHRYQQLQDKSNRWQRLGMAWVALVLASLILLMAISARQAQELGFWVAVVAILGPLGLLARLAVGRHRPPSAWLAALLEAAGDVTPAAVAFLALVVASILVPTLLASQRLQVVLLLGLPLALGWLAFQGPLLAVVTKKGYVGTLGLRLPHALVSANLGTAGIVAVALPLVNLSIRACSIMTLSVWMVGAWWGLAVLGAVVGGSLLFLHELWAVRRGFRAWGVLASKAGEVLSPSWRKLWWWIPLSYAALFGGLVASQLLQRMPLA